MIFFSESGGNQTKHWPQSHCFRASIISTSIWYFFWFWWLCGCKLTAVNMDSRKDEGFRIQLSLEPLFWKHQGQDLKSNLSPFHGRFGGIKKKKKVQILTQGKGVYRKPNIFSWNQISLTRWHLNILQINSLETYGLNFPWKAHEFWYEGGTYFREIIWSLPKPEYLRNSSRDFAKTWSY